jgi:uncharacterized protein
MKTRMLSLALAAAVALPALSMTARAAETPPTPRILVQGEGEAAVAPDMAILTLAVMREAATAREAMDDANAAMEAVIAAMREAGIADRDLQTAGLSINPRYVYPQEPDGEQQPRIVAYQVSNTLTVRVRDTAIVGEILDRSVTLGVNQGGSISFVNDDPAAALDEARRQAVADAMARARTLADAAGVDLGRILEISEQASLPPPMPLGAKTMRMEITSDAAVPIEAGENTYRIVVGVTFELGEQP